MYQDSTTSRLAAAVSERDRLRAEYEAACRSVASLLVDCVDTEGMPQSEVAALLGVSRPRVNKLVQRARAELAEAWREERHAANAIGRDGPDNRGFESGGTPCFSCHRFKSRPSSVCDFCGDDPVSHNGDRHSFDRAYGYAA